MDARGEVLLLRIVTKSALVVLHRLKTVIFAKKNRLQNEVCFSVRGGLWGSNPQPSHPQCDALPLS